MYWSPRLCASLSATLRQLRQLAGEMHLARRAFHLRHPRDFVAQPLLQRARIAARLGDQPRDPLVVEQRQQHVLGLDVLVIVA
jgi:hypothetical protein